MKLEKEDMVADNPMNPGNFKKVKLIPDGAAHFTRAMGFSCLWDTERGHINMMNMIFTLQSHFRAWRAILEIQCRYKRHDSREDLH